MVIGYKSLRGKCAAIPCHIQLAAPLVMGVEKAKGWGAWPLAAQVFTWVLIRLVHSDAYSVVRVLRHNITDRCHSMKSVFCFHIHPIHSSAIKTSSGWNIIWNITSL